METVSNIMFCPFLTSDIIDELYTQPVDWLVISQQTIIFIIINSSSIV
jgi:hypothetical protein